MIKIHLFINPGSGHKHFKLMDHNIMEHFHRMKHFQIKTNHGYSTPVITNLGDLANTESLQKALELVLPPAQDLGNGIQLNFTSMIATDGDNMVYQFTFYSPYDENNPDYQDDIADLITKHVQEAEIDSYCHWTYNHNILTFIIQFYS